MVDRGVEVGVDEAGHQQVAGCVDLAIGAALTCGFRLNRSDHSILDVDRRCWMFSVRRVHRQDARVADDGLQRGPPGRSAAWGG